MCVPTLSYAVPTTSTSPSPRWGRPRSKPSPTVTPSSPRWSAGTGSGRAPRGSRGRRFPGPSSPTSTSPPSTASCPTSAAAAAARATRAPRRARRGGIPRNRSRRRDSAVSLSNPEIVCCREHQIVVSGKLCVCVLSHVLDAVHQVLLSKPNNNIVISIMVAIQSNACRRRYKHTM